MKSWIRVVGWTAASSFIGAIIAYVLFGLVWTNWGSIAGEFATPHDNPSGDPIDNWAQGVVAMMIAIPVVLAGIFAGAVIGFRLSRRKVIRKRRLGLGAGLATDEEVDRQRS